MPRPARLAAIVALALLFFVGPTLVTMYTDWLWFGELGYRQVFTAMISGQSLLFIAGFVMTALWLTLHVRLAMQSIGTIRPVYTTRDGIEVPLPGRQQLDTLLSAGTLVVALLAGLFAANRWEVWLSWWHGGSFGTADPVLGHDIAFYVFSLPFFRFLTGFAQALLVLAVLASGAIYLMTGSLTSGFPAGLTMSRYARQHLSALAATFFLLLAVSAWLQRAEYLVQPSGMFFGAAYADVHGRIPAMLAVTAAALAGAGLSIVNLRSTRLWPIPAAIAIYLLANAAGQGYSVLLQRFVVTPNEQARETPYLQFNIDATRRAFDLADIEVRPLSGDALLTRDDIARNAATLENVRLWDHQPLLETFGQIQEIRTYYDFASVDNDRYLLNGSLRQVMLSARELNSNSLPNRTWVNERLTFTHGYGLTLGPVNQVTDEGLPVLLVRDLPPQTAPGLTIDEPSLYFGELSNDYVIVRTRTREFHYPRGNDNVFTQYDGQGGIRLDSFWRKLLFALRFQSYQILLSDDITDDSRILFNRNIRERLRRLAPFLVLDQDPYLVLADGRLYWIADAYTTSRMYPYSTPVAGVNYIRNSVKFVIDAYHGTTTAYLADPDDPIAQTYDRIFPGFFKPLAEMPASLRSHVRYPEDIFGVQAQVYATYHMTQPAVLYNREDQWDIPALDEAAGEARPMQPYYTIMRLPGEADPEFIQMLPFTPRSRDNLAAWLVARSDGAHYGKLRVFEFPKQKLVFGPRQVVARIAQDQVISPQITLWNQQGSQVIWGTLMVIPIEESLIYVRPLYLRASGGRIPELTRVIVAYENRIVMEESLSGALARLFDGDDRGAPRPDSRSTPSTTDAPGATTTPAGGVPPALAALAAEAAAHYDRAIAAQRNGDWATYGTEIEALGRLLGQMRGR